MASERSLSTPAAVLIGSVIIALAVVFGPMIRGDASDRAQPAAPPVTAAEPAPPRKEDPAAPPVTSAPASTEAVTAEATKALEKLRKELLDRCWKPAVAKQPDPPTFKVTFNFTFDATGRQVARGAREDRATARPEIRECIDDVVSQITISPPGAAVYVQVPLTLP
jgi:hypothetical protein